MIDAIGVIGVGQLGICFVERLLSGGFKVVVYDSDPKAVARAQQLGATSVDSPAEVGRMCRRVLLCVTGPADVLEVTLGDGGILDAAQPGTTVIDLTTSLPSASRAVERELYRHGIRFLDAPVSRGVPAARRGELSIMVGGDNEGLAAAKPILDLLGTDIALVGPCGSGHTVKLLNMMLMGCHLVAVSEAIGIAALNGIGPSGFLGYLESSTASSYMATNHLPKFVLSGSYSSGFTLPLMLKDLKLAKELAESSGTDNPIAQVALSEYVRAHDDLAVASEGSPIDNMRVVPYIAARAIGASRLEAAAQAIQGELPIAQGTGCNASELVNVLARANATACREACSVANAAEVDVEDMLSMVSKSSGASLFTAGKSSPRKPLPKVLELADAQLLRTAFASATDGSSH